MRIQKFFAVAIAITVAATSLSALNHEGPAENTALLARLAYEDNGAAASVPRKSVCMAIWQGGQYRIFRNGDLVGPRRLQGSMSDAQLKQLLSMLDAADFRGLSNAHGDFVREEFIAEVRHEKGAQHVVLVIPDTSQAFPKAAADVIHWMLTFKPEDAERWTNADSGEDVCPLPNVSPYVPVTANR